MEHQFKMICLDLDGTLLNSESRISQENIDTLRACLDRGMHVFLVTGRPYCFTRYLADQISEKVEVICFNGGCYPKDGELIQKQIPADALSRIIHLMEKYHTPAFFKGTDFIYTHEAYDKRFLYDHMNDLAGFPASHSRCSLSWEDLRSTAKDVVKVLVYNFDKEVLQALKQEMMTVPGLTVSSYNDISFDINAEQVNKGNAMKDVMAAYGIRREEVISFGDSNNDIAMFEASGYRVAMANAKEAFRQLSDEVTLSNNEDGVAHVLKRYLQQ